MAQVAPLCSDTKLLIFGLDRGTSAADVRTLLGHCQRRLRQVGEQIEVEVLEVPGDNDDAFAVVHLWRDPVLMWTVASQINSRRLRGRPLQSITSAFTW